MVSIKKIKSEYIVLLLAWMFWGIAEIVSWRYYNQNLGYSKMFAVKSLQALFALSFNLILIEIISVLQKKINNRVVRFSCFVVLILIFSVLIVLCNSTTYRTMMEMEERFIKLPAIIMFALQKIIYLSGFTTLFFMIRNLKELQHQKKQALLAHNAAVESQLQMLQQQINPHFLFNALNSLRNLISSDVTKAREMVTNISDFLRETLQTNNQGEITITEEIKILENYLDIQKIRFGDDLMIKYTVAPEALKYRVPAFILQPLAENAIKHGMITKSTLSLQIKIEKSEDELLLSVMNNGKLTPEDTDSGNGNTNIEKRLKLLYNGHSTFSLYEKDGHVYSDIRIKTTKL